MFIFWRHPARHEGLIYTSPDGIHWNERGPTSQCGDNSSFFIQPVSPEVRLQHPPELGPASALVFRAPGLLADRPLEPRSAGPLGARRPARPARPATRHPPAALRRKCRRLREHPARRVRHFSTDRKSRRRGVSRPKINDLQLAYSRDGFHWHRPHRQAFIAASRQWGDWNYGYIHAAGGICLVVGDELWFYYGAFSGQGSVLKPGETGSAYEQANAMYAGGHTGLATLRRDGFASMQADSPCGVLATRLVTFSGSHLFVNLDAPEGELRVESWTSAATLSSRSHWTTAGHSPPTLPVPA